MARVSNEMDVRQAMGLTGAAQQAIESASWVVLDAAADYKYEDLTDDNGDKVYDKHGNVVSKKTDSQAGTTVLLGGPRKGDDLIRNKQMKVKLDDMWTEDQCNLVAEVGPEVQVKIERAVVWGSSRKDSTFVSLNLSLHAKLIDENGEAFDPRKIKKGGK